MTAHTHSEPVPGCYRCDLSRDEAREQIREVLGHVVDTSGVAAVLGVKPTSVTRYRVRDASFPPPLVRFGGATPVWLRADIVAWQASRPGRVGRPRRTATQDETGINIL